MTEKLSPEAQALFNKYAGSQPQEQESFSLSDNARSRMQNTVRQYGLTREQAQADPAMLKLATARALAEQANNRGQLPHAEGVGGRSFSNSTKGVRVGRSLADIARDDAEATA